MKIRKIILLDLVLLAQVTLLLNFTMTDNNIKTNTSNLVRMTPLSVENREGSPSSKFPNFVESQSKVDDLAAEIMFCNLQIFAFYCINVMYVMTDIYLTLLLFSNSTGRIDVTKRLTVKLLDPTVTLSLICYEWPLHGRSSFETFSSLIKRLPLYHPPFYNSQCQQWIHGTTLRT